MNKTIRINGVAPERWLRAILLLLSTSALVGGQINSTGIPQPDSAAREKILDLAFVHVKQPGQATRSSMVLRFLPSSHPEKEIHILFGTAPGVIAEYSAASVQLEAALANAPPERRGLNARAVVESMRVRRKSITVRPEIGEEWLRQFWQAFAASAEILKKRALEGKVQLDGAEYRVKYDGAMEHLSLTFQDSEVGQDQPDDLPLARWMNSIRAQVEKMVGKPGEDRAPTAR